MHSKAICQHSNTLHSILIYPSIRYTYHRRKQGDCTHTHTQQLPSVLVTFFEVPWSDPTDICPEVSHSFPRPNKLVQQGVSMGVDNGTPKESSRPQRQLGMSWHDWTCMRQLQQTTPHVHPVQYSDIYLKGGKVKV